MTFEEKMVMISDIAEKIFIASYLNIENKLGDDPDLMHLMRAFVYSMLNCHLMSVKTTDDENSDSGQLIKYELECLEGQLEMIKAKFLPKH